MPLVLVDIRDKSDAMKGYIPGAVSYPLKDLEQAKAKFPKQKGAPIIIITENDKDAVDAFKIVREWGYKNASILEGGISGWTKAGNSLSEGQLSTKIAYVPKPVPGSIPIKDFKSVVKSNPADSIIIDVRDADEVAEGMLKGAINIPTQEIDSRLSEIPKNKKIIVHCKTGTRASMAYQTLKEHGYDAFFLNATILIKPNGRFKIKS